MAAHKFGCRPSSLAGLDDPVLALDFDLAATVRLMEIERRAVSEAGTGSDEERNQAAESSGVFW